MADEEDQPDSEWVIPRGSWPVGDPLPSDMVGRVITQFDAHWYYDTEQDPAGNQRTYDQP